MHYRQLTLVRKRAMVASVNKRFRLETPSTRIEIWILGRFNSVHIVSVLVAVESDAVVAGMTTRPIRRQNAFKTAVTRNGLAFPEV